MARRLNVAVFKGKDLHDTGSMLAKQSPYVVAQLFRNGKREAIRKVGARVSSNWVGPRKTIAVSCVVVR